MPVSPQDFQLWASLTGNKYPSSVQEKAALTPEVYSFTRNLGRKGGVRDLSHISYDQPEALDHPNPDALIHAPVTPDNSVPKVAGTHDHSLTSQHYENEQADHAVEQGRFRRAVDIAGKTALVAGGTAAAVALARNPTVQRAAQEAAGAVRTHIGDVGARVSDFLGGFMGNERTPGTQVIDVSGDVTPPTTAQRYQQDIVPTQTRLLQATSGAPPQVQLKDVISKGFGTNAPTIAASQSFGPQPRGPLNVEGTPAGSAVNYRPGKDITLIAKPENINWPKEKEYTPYIPNPLHRDLQHADPEVIAARRAARLGTALPEVYAPGEQPFSKATQWVEQTYSPAEQTIPSVGLKYTQTADPFTGEYTPQVKTKTPLAGLENYPLNKDVWEGSDQPSVLNRTENFISELQQTKPTQLLPSASIADVTAAGPVAMPQYEKDVNFDQQTSDIGVAQTTPVSNYDPVNISSIQERLAPWKKGPLGWTGVPDALQKQGEWRIHSNLNRAINLAATTGDYSLLDKALPRIPGQRYGGMDVEKLTTSAYAGQSPSGTNVLENLPTSKFFVDISNLKKLPYEVGVTGAEGSIPLGIEQKMLETGELGIADPRLARAGTQVKYLRGQEIAASNRKSQAISAYLNAIDAKRAQLRDPREIAAFEEAPHLHPSIAPFADEMERATLKHDDIKNQLEGKVLRTEAELPALGLSRSGEPARGFTFLTEPRFATQENPLGIYGAEPRQAYKSMYTPELYKTAAESAANVGFKGLGRGDISPEQIMVTAAGKGYRAGREEGVNPASIADPTLAENQPWLRTPEGLTYVQRALTSSGDVPQGKPLEIRKEIKKEGRAALSLLEQTHKLNEAAKEARAQGNLQKASELLQKSIGLKAQASSQDPFVTQFEHISKGVTPEGERIRQQMELERQIKAGQGPQVSLPKTDWSEVSRGQLQQQTQKPQLPPQTREERQALLNQRAAELQEILGGQTVHSPLIDRLNLGKPVERLTQRETGVSGRLAEMRTGPETTRRVISGYETPHIPMSEPYNPHLGTRVTQLPADVLSQHVGPGITIPAAPTGPRTYPSSPLPSQQLNIPGTQEAATTPVGIDPHIAHLQAYMARRAAQLPARFSYVEPAQQLGLRFR